MKRRSNVNDTRLPSSHARKQSSEGAGTELYTPLPPMNPEVARLRRQAAQRKYLKGLRYVRVLWAIAAVLLFMLVIEVVLALCFSPRFWIFRVVVQGNETIAEGDVLRLLRLPVESNYSAPRSTS